MCSGPHSEFGGAAIMPMESSPSALSESGSRHDRARWAASAASGGVVG
jgi:hypothetical protein